MNTCSSYSKQWLHFLLINVVYTSMLNKLLFSETFYITVCFYNMVQPVSTSMLAQTHTYTHTHTHVHTHTHANTHTHKHKHTHTHMRTHTHTHTHTHKHAHTVYIERHINRQMYNYGWQFLFMDFSNLCTHIHTHTNICTHILYAYVYREG